MASSEGSDDGAQDEIADLLYVAGGVCLVLIHIYGGCEQATGVGSMVPCLGDRDQTR